MASLDLYLKEDNYWWSVIRRRELVYAFKRFSKSQLQAPFKILDIGCGGGALLKDFSLYGEVFGVDISAQACAFSSKKIGHLALADARSLPFKGSSFNVVLVADVIEHIDEESLVLKEIRRVCSCPGLCILTVPAYNCLWGKRDLLLGHKRRYVIDDLRRILKKSGFEMVNSSYTCALLFPPLFFANKIWSLFKRQPLKTDIVSLPKSLNKLLIYLFTLESRVLLRLPSPIGTSIICVARKMPCTTEDSKTF
jgi:SAM-dependent methyltransferase